MARRWLPPTDRVGPNEHVGRRLFDEPLLAGAIDQQVFSGLLITHFEETRDADLSLDRLGKSGVDGRVMSYLLPRALDAGTRFHRPKRFDGWAVLRSTELGKPRQGRPLMVVPSPILGNGNEQADEKDLTLNIYHAHVTKPDDMDAYDMALHLKHLFTRYGQVHAVNTLGKSAPRRFSRKWAYKWVCNAVSRLPWLRRIAGRPKV